MRYPGEHCEGYAVDLWRQSGALVGVLRYCFGLADTLPNNPLKNGVIDGARVHFETDLSTGSDYVGQGRQAPAQDHWRFDGKLSAGRISGTITKRDANFPKQPARHERLVLKREKSHLPSFADTQAWTHWLHRPSP